MAQIVPSILENTVDKFLGIYAKEVKLPGVQRIQVDFGDGKFVPNTILPVTEIDALTPAIHWEAHLMVEAPHDFLDYQICGFKTIVVHYEAYQNKDDLLTAVDQIKQMGMEPGICIKIETPVSVLQEFDGVVKHFQLMSVKPGQQGNPFYEGIYDKIAELRNLCPSVILEVDGGVSFGNIKKIAQSGADLIIAGSVITKADNMLEAYEKLKSSLTGVIPSASEESFFRAP